MTYIPDNFILRAIENAMQSQRKLDNPEVGSEVSAGSGNRRDYFLPEFFREFFHRRRNP